MQFETSFVKNKTDNIQPFVTANTAFVFQSNFL